MKLITQNNYEEIFLDYIEGEINAQDKEALELFLAQNPDLKAELNEMMDMDLKCEGGPVSEETASLKNIPFQTNFNDFCIAQLEGDLDSYENEAFCKFIATNPDKQKELALYQKTKLQADKTIVFTNKKALKKKNEAFLFRQFIFTTLATAASIAILFSIWTTEIESGSIKIESELMSQNTALIIVKQDTVNMPIRKDLKTNKAAVKENNHDEIKKPSKTKIKGKILNKQIIKIDALPIRAEVSPNKPLNKIKVKRLLANNIIVPIEISHQTNMKLVKKIQTSQEVPQSTGLAMLGLSWKASKGDREVREKSTLLKIASFGVNKIGKLAGKKINLEKKYDPKTDKTRIAFNTLGIGFSKTVK